MRGLTGKNAVVTGGGSGIGRAICERLSEEGCGTVAILDLNEKGAIETKERINARLPNAHVVTYQVDISDQAAVIHAIDHFRDSLAAPIHILVNNAGWDRAVLFMDSDRAFWEKLVHINLMGAFNVTHAALKHMIKDGGGKVVFVASDAGRVGSSGESVYAACKGGLIAFAKSLSREVARYNILLNSVCPGPTNTPLLAAFQEASEMGTKFNETMKKASPLRRIGEPEDCAAMVAYLASDDANFILGQTISVSGGLTMHG